MSVYGDFCLKTQECPSYPYFNFAFTSNCSKASNHFCPLYEFSSKICMNRIDAPIQCPDNSHWKCQKLCRFSSPYKEGADRSICQYLSDYVKQYGVEKTVEKYGDVSKVSTYGDGGGRLADNDKK